MQEPALNRITKIIPSPGLKTLIVSRNLQKPGQRLEIFLIRLSHPTRLRAVLRLRLLSHALSRNPFGFRKPLCQDPSLEYPLRGPFIATYARMDACVSFRCTLQRACWSLQCTHKRHVYYNHADPCSFESIIVPFSREEVALEVVPVVEAVAVVVAELVSG